MSQISIQIEINDAAVPGHATQKLNRIDSTGTLARLAAANRGIHGNKSDDDATVILKSLAAAVQSAET